MKNTPEQHRHEPAPTPAHPMAHPHPRAKPALRQRARELRREGATYAEIVAELGVAKSSVSLWVRDLPRPERRRRPREEASALARRGWEPRLRASEEERQRVRATAVKEVGTLTDRELFLVGVGLYWAEGAKSKPYRRQESLVFVNSDPGMIRLYLAWLALLGVSGEHLGFRVMIHERADVAGAERYWASLAGISTHDLSKTTLKKHNPRTTRKNVGEHYHGCLVVAVRKSAHLYRRVEGAWQGIVWGARSAETANRT